MVNSTVRLKISEECRRALFANVKYDFTLRDCSRSQGDYFLVRLNASVQEHCRDEVADRTESRNCRFYRSQQALLINQTQIKEPLECTYISGNTHTFWHARELHLV